MTRRLPIVFMFLALSTGACAPAFGDSGENTMSDCPLLHTTTAWDGKSEEAVRKILGPPDYEEDFLMGDGLPEARVELFNLFPLPQNATRRIRELVWGDHSCQTTIWLTENASGNWIVVQGAYGSGES
ncbi:MAG: hypothetical protein ACK5NN_07770 [Sphingomonadaceae bacterium]